MQLFQGGVSLVAYRSSHISSMGLRVFSGTSGEAGGAELAGYLARTNYTPAGALLRDECEVWAKPGWFPDNGELVATNDAGVVFSESGPYVFAVMTDMSANLDGLTPLIDALDAAHDVMCGGESPQ